MASNAARKSTRREDISQPEIGNEIQKKKEVKLQEIEEMFRSVNERVKGKSSEIAKLQIDLMDLLHKIPDNGGADFQSRLKDFADSFGHTKRELNRLVEADAYFSPDEKASIEEAGAEQKRQLQSEDAKEIKSGIKLKRENFTDEFGNVLDGVETVGKKFEGEIKLADGYLLLGQAKNINGKFLPDGNSTIERRDGEDLIYEAHGIWEDGDLQNGLVFEKDLLLDNTATVRRVKNGVASVIETGEVNENFNLDGVGERLNKFTKTKEVGKFKNGELQRGVVVEEDSGKVLKEVGSGTALRENQKDAEKTVLKDFYQEETEYFLNGELKDDKEGKIFVGQITDRQSTINFKGIAKADQAGIYHFYKGHAEIKNSDGVRVVDDGTWADDGGLEDGMRIIYAADGSIIEKFLYVEGKMGTPQEHAELREQNRKAEVNEMIEKISKLAGLDGFRDFSRQELKGSLRHTPEGKHIFDGEIKSTIGDFEYHGEAILGSDGIFRPQGQGKRTSELFGYKSIQEGEFKNGILENGTKIKTGRNVGWDAQKMVARVEAGKEVDAVFEIESVQDKAGLEFGGKMFEKEFAKDNLYVGEFTMPNGSVYKGEATKNEKDEFVFLPGKKERIKSATVIDKFKDLFVFGRKKKEAAKPTVNTEAEAEPEESQEVAVEQAFLIVTPGGENFVLNGLATDQPDGSRKFKGEIKNIDNSGQDTNFNYSGEAIISSNNEIVYHGEGKKTGIFFVEEGQWNMGKLENGEVRSQDGDILRKYVNGQETKFEVKKPDDKQAEAGTKKTKEKGWLGKKIESAKEAVVSAYEFVTTKEGARLSNQAAYKIATGFVGIKIGTDIALAAYAGALNKVGENDWFSESFRNRLKEEATVAGEYSDVYKHLGGREQIVAIKAGFAEFMGTLNPKEGENIEISVVDEKYSALKTKIESANRINQEAKGKLLKKLEDIKQKFDSKNEKLTKEEVAEGAAYMKAYLVNDTAGMQIVRDGLSGAAKATMMVASAGSSLLLSAAIGRVMGMATTKVVERRQKSAKFNEQAKLEGRNTFTTAEDIKVALLETMHGLSFGKFNAGKDVKTGKDLSKKEVFLNFSKSIGNVLIATGVVLGLEGKTIGSAVSEFVNKIFGDGPEGQVGQQMAQNLSAKVEAKGVNIPNIPDNAPAAAAIAATEAKVAAVAAGSAADHVVSDKGLEYPANSAAVEQANGNSSGEILSIKDLSKVRGFASWEREMLKGMKYEFHGRNIHHSYLFHPGAKIEFVGTDNKSIYTYTVPGGGSAAGAMEKFHQEHPELFKNKEGWSQIKGVRLIDTAAEGKRPTIEVPKNILIESHRGGHTAFKEGGAAAKPALDKVISNEKISNSETQSMGKVKIGPNIKAAIPQGWEVQQDKQGLSIVGVNTGEGGGEVGREFLPIYSGQDVRWIDIKSGKIFDTNGHVGDLNFGDKGANMVAGSGADSGSKISWSNGGNISPEERATLLKSISHQPAEKGTVTEVVAKADRVGRHGGGGAPKESASVVPAEKPIQETEVTVESKVSAKAAEAEVKPGAAQPPVEEKAVEPQPEAAPVVKEITSLEDGRDAIAGLEYLDADEKMRLNNFSYLLEWQKSLYGQNGSTLRNMLEAQDAFGILDKAQINAMMSELSHDNEAASKEFMKAVADHQPYSKIIEKLNDKMPGYSIFHDASNSGFTDRVMGTDLSQNIAENKTNFRDLEVERVKELIDKTQTEKYLQARQARNE